MGFLTIIIVVAVVLISHKSLSSRISSLEEKLKGGAPMRGNVPVPPTQPQSVVDGAQPAMTGGMEEYIQQRPVMSPIAPAFTAAQPAGPNALERFGAWVKEDWLMKLGAFLFVIGCGWFVSYAFANNWIGPVGRISLGIIVGALVMAFGYWRMIRFPSQGAVFMALGAGVAILSIFAGRAVYHFFTPASAIAFDFIFVAFVSVASYKFNVRSLAFSAQVLAFASPLLTAGQTDPPFLFSYLLVVSLATLVLAGLLGWRDLIVSSLLFVGLYSLPYFSGHSSTGIYGTNAPVILNFAYLFAMLYFFTGMFAVVKKGVENAQGEIALAVGNGLFLFLWIYTVGADEWQTLLFSAWAIVFAVGSFVAFRFSSKLHPFYAYGSVAVAFIAAATAAQLDGAALTFAFSVEAFMVIVTVLALTKSAKVASSALLLFFAPIILSFSSMVKYLAAHELFTKDFFVLIFLAIFLIFAGRLIRAAEEKGQEKDGSSVWAAAIVFGTLYLWFTVWCFMHILMPETPDMATLATLVIYTIAGLWAYFAGLYGNDISRRVYGAALLIFVVVRLLLIDVWSMELFGRVITFFAIGILLMSTAFLTKRRAGSVPVVQPSTTYPS